MPKQPQSTAADSTLNSFQTDWDCSKCGESFDSRDELQSHLHEEHDVPWSSMRK